ncbi:MAG: hypothetical protein FWE23_10515 [Chitinivibrionia bacterium]|nr:hypothetical protein [Chitinivibrionia bacterium]
MNNNAPIGTLTLDAQSANTNTRINIGSAFNGNVQRLDLRGQNNDVATWWDGRTVLEGNFAPYIPMFNSALGLGEFVSETNDREGIAPRVINAWGVLESRRGKGKVLWLAFGGWFRRLLFRLL